MLITDVDSRMTKKEVLFSPSFTSAEDPQPVSFKMHIAFNGENKVSACVVPASRSVQYDLLKFDIFDNMRVIRSMHSSNKEEIPRRKSCGFQNIEITPIRPILSVVDGPDNFKWGGTSFVFSCAFINLQKRILPTFQNNKALKANDAFS